MVKVNSFKYAEKKVLKKLENKEEQTSVSIVDISELKMIFNKNSLISCNLEGAAKVKVSNESHNLEVNFNWVFSIHKKELSISFRPIYKNLAKKIKYKVKKELQAIIRKDNIFEGVAATIFNMDIFDFAEKENSQEQVFIGTYDFKKNDFCKKCFGMEVEGELLSRFVGTTENYNEDLLNDLSAEFSLDPQFYEAKELLNCFACFYTINKVKIEQAEIEIIGVSKKSLIFSK